MKRVVAILLAVSVLVALSSCSSKETIETTIERFERIAEDTQAASQDDILIFLGILEVDRSGVGAMNVDVMRAYMEMHSATELLIKLQDIKRGLNDRTEPSREEEYSSAMNSIMSMFVYINNLQTIEEAMLSNAGTYYKDNPKAPPQASREIVTGRFYDRDGTNGHTQKRTNEKTVQYKGDFAIQTETKYSYDKGAYGWSGGKFYDILPSWKVSVSETIWYKGSALCDRSNAKNTYLYIDESGKVYQIRING